MKRAITLITILFACYIAQGQKVVYSNRENVKTVVNGTTSGWGISPETNPDRLRVYCTREVNEVVFMTDVDTAVFRIRKNDTIRFLMILNHKDTARTEIVGIKELPRAISLSDKTYWLSKIWAETQYNFVNADQLTFNLDSLYRAFIPIISATQNDYEFYHVLREFLAYLHDGHSEVSDNGQFFIFRDYIPVSLRDFDNRVYVSSVRKIPGQDSAWVGAELIEIEGVSTRQYLETKIFPTISASTNQHLWMQGVSKIQNDLKDCPFHGTIKRRDGVVEKITLQRNGEAIRTPHDQYWGPVQKYPEGNVELEWLENKIARVNFNRFYPEEEAIGDFNKIAPQLKDARGVIIDLRYNGGGSTEVAWQLQRYLTKEKFFLNFGWETRINDGVKKANGNWIEEDKPFYLNRAYHYEAPDTVWVPDTLKRITCPVVILIGRYTFSAAEDFLVNLYECKNRPLLIGEETGGSTGSPLVISGLPGDGYARVCTRRICFPYSKKPFVNQGIKPDIKVSPTIETYLEGRDPVLERAVRELNGR